MMMSYANYTGEYAMRIKTLPFADQEGIDDFARLYMEQAYALGLIAGYEDNTFRPQNLLRRGECVVFLQRLADYPE